MSETSNGWPEYKQKVLYQLEETIIKIKEVDQKIDLFKEEMNMRFQSLSTDLTIIKTETKTKTKVYAGVVAFASTIIAIIINIIFNIFETVK